MMNFINDFSIGFFEIIIGSFLAFLCILTYNRKKKLDYSLFILAAFFLYITTVFRVLENLNIFSISDYKVFNIPLLKFIIYNASSFFMIAGFVVFLKKKG